MMLYFFFNRDFSQEQFQIGDIHAKNTDNMDLYFKLTGSSK